MRWFSLSFSKGEVLVFAQSISIAVGLVVLLPELAGVERTGWCGGAGNDQQSKQGGCEGLHDGSPFFKSGTDDAVAAVFR
jgi:hypothetical protein